MLYKYKADNQSRGLAALTAPIVAGQLITYLGFKEMLVFGGSQDTVYSVDADLNRLIWKSHFEYRGDKPAAPPTSVCPGSLTASPTMPGSSTFIAVRGAPPAMVPGAPGRGTGQVLAAPSTLPATPPGRGPAGLFATGFGRSGVFIAVGSDGYIHALNTSTGADKITAQPFLPPNAKAVGININEGVVYAATENNCGGNPNAIYALDLSGDPLSETEHKLAVFRDERRRPGRVSGERP